MFVLDTNILIYYFKGMGQVAEQLLNVSPSEIRIPTVVLFELYVGIAKSSSPEKRSQQLSNLLTQVAVLPLDSKAAKCAAQLRACLEEQGQPISPIDILIAGTALAQSATLVTHNVREFSRVPELVVVDWFSRA